LRRKWGRPVIGNFKWAPPRRQRWVSRPARWKPLSAGWPAKPAGTAGFKPRRVRWTARASGWRPKPGGGREASGRWRTRRPRRLKRLHVWLIAVLALTFLFLQTFAFFDKHLKDPLLFLAKVRITQIASEAINTAIAERFSDQEEAGKLIQWQKNESGKITGFLIDYKEHLRITADTIRVVERVLKEKEEVPEHIPIGHALNSPLLSSIGPRIAVRFQPAGAVKVDVNTRQMDAGINMLLVEVYIHIRTDIAVIIPFDEAPETVETEIPISYLLVVGDVPMYYYDNKGNPIGNGAAQAPTLSLPPNPVMGGGASAGSGSGGSVKVDAGTKEPGASASEGSPAPSAAGQPGPPASQPSAPGP